MWPFTQDKFEPELSELSGDYDNSLSIDSASWVRLIKDANWRPGSR